MEEKKEVRKKSAIANSRVGVFDKSSGEVLDEGALIFVPKKLRIKGFFMAMQDGLENLAKKKELNGESLKVLLFLMSRMDYENEIYVSNGEICEVLDMRKQNVCRAVKRLRESGALEEPKPKCLRLSTDVGWKGKVANLRREQSQQSRAACRPLSDVVEAVGK